MVGLCGLVYISNSAKIKLLVRFLANRKAEQSKKSVNADFSVGERVKHNVFGDGTVISVKKISNDAMLEVAFDSVGTKKLMANFAKITKI